MPDDYLSSVRLKIYGLIEGLEDAVKNSDRTAAKELRERLILEMPLSAVLEDHPAKSLDAELRQVLAISDRWIKRFGSDAVTDEEVLRAIERTIPLLMGPVAWPREGPGSPRE